MNIHPAGMRPRIVLIQTQAEGAGAQEISRLLGDGLERRGCEVHHVFFFRRTAAFDRQSNVYFCANERPRSPVALARMFIRLVRHLRALRPAAVLCFQQYGIALGAPAARMAGVSRVIANRTSSRRTEAAVLRWLDLAYGLSGMFGRMVVNSALMAEDYATSPRVYRRRVVRIDHGFASKRSDLTPAAARDRFALPRDACIIGSVARLHRDKQLDIAVRLLATHPAWHLAVAGQGAAEAELRALAVRLGVASRVHFAGELAPADVAAFLRGLDVFVFPSRNETFGLAAVEAAQAGVPVVANDLVVLREVLEVKGEPCALFADAADPEAFAAAIARVLADPALRALLAARGGALAERYSLDMMVSRYAGLLEGVVPSGISALRS
jgi:glycosyltransferase involved in cell wall biosynthesis